MNKLTKAKRHSIYTKMLKLYNDYIKDIENHNIERGKGFCETLLDLGYQFGNPKSLIHRLGDLPELNKFEPEQYVIYWFTCKIEGMNKRRDILIKCIDQTKPIPKVKTDDTIS